MQETSLHVALKNWYTQEGDSQEVAVEGFFVDVVSGEQLIEIQTRNFTAIRPKLATLLEGHRIRLVHPIAREKWIVRLPAQGEHPLDRRKSPKRGRPEDLFFELVRIPHLVAHPNFTIEILLITEEELRRNDGRGSWRRRGWSIADRRLISVIERVVLENPADFLAFLPMTLPGIFTSRDLANEVRISIALAKKILYCLRIMGVIEATGKKGNSILYSKNRE
jgi:hypothetical protein